MASSALSKQHSQSQDVVWDAMYSRRNFVLKLIYFAVLAKDIPLLTPADRKLVKYTSGWFESIINQLSTLENP